MEELPCMLVGKIGGPDGVVEEHLEFLKKHVCIVTLKEFKENQNHFSDKITSIFDWCAELKIHRELLESLPKLKVVAVSGAGVDHLDLQMISTFGVKVANTPQSVSSATADFAMTLLLASSRNLLEGIQRAASPETKTLELSWMTDDVTGFTIGIIGMGSIGYKIAQRAKAFEMHILYHNRKRRCAEDEKAVGATYCEKLEDLLQRSDYVVVAVTLTPETVKMLGRREFEIMKPTATLVNISRGAVVDQDALVEALQIGLIKAAAIDVTYPEPLPRDHPLLKMKNVIVTPHMASYTRHCRMKTMKTMVTNILAAINDLPIPNEFIPK